jgi:hypothetical protein
VGGIVLHIGSAAVHHGVLCTCSDDRFVNLRRQPVVAHQNQQADACFGSQLRYRPGFTHASRNLQG